jgi:hypothetical protein
MLRKLNKLIERMKKSHDQGDYADCVKTASQIIDQDPRAFNFYLKSQSYICSCHTKAKNTAEAIKTCGELLDKNPNDAETLYNRAQAYIIDEQLELGKILYFLLNFKLFILFFKVLFKILFSSTGLPKSS